MPIKTARWNDPPEADDGLRLLICRYRPRALAKNLETWDLWLSNLGPSRELHAALYGKAKDANGKPIKIAELGWHEFRYRFLSEMETEKAREMIAGLAARVRAGQTITLLCSSACTDPARCHRSLVKELIEAAIA